MVTRPSTVQFISIAVILFCLTCGATFYSILRTGSVAQQFYAEILALKVGKSSRSDALKIVQRYSGKPLGSCDEHYCAYIFEFNNTVLRVIHLAPDTRLAAVVSVRDGVVCKRRVVVISGGLAASQVSVEEVQSDRSGTLGAVGQKSDGPWRIDLRVSPLVSAGDHAAAYALNVACLSQIGGCPNARQIMPTLDKVIAAAGLLRIEQGR